MTYTFHRASGWYPVELSSDEEACRNALCNPGTEKVVNEISGETIWTDVQTRDQAIGDQ